MTWGKVIFFWFFASLGAGFPSLVIVFFSKVYPIITYIVHKEIKIPIEEYSRINKENAFFKTELKRYREKGESRDDCHRRVRDNSNSSY